MADLNYTTDTPTVAPAPNLFATGLTKSDIDELPTKGTGTFVDRISELNQIIIELQVKREYGGLLAEEDQHLSAALDEYAALAASNASNEQAQASLIKTAQPTDVKAKDSVPSPLLSAATAVKTPIVNVAKWAGAGFEQLDGKYQSLMKGISTEANVVKVSINGSEQSIKGFIGPELQGFTNFMNKYFGSNCQYVFRNTNADIKIGTELVSWIANMGFLKALECLMSGKMLDDVTWKNIVKNATKNITLSGDFKMLHTILLHSIHGHVPVKTQPSTIVDICHNYKDPYGATQQTRVADYGIAMSTFDGMSPGWSTFARNGVIDSIDARAIPDASPAFRKMMQANSASMVIGFNEQLESSILATAALDRDEVFMAISKAYQGPQSAKVDLSRRYAALAI